MPDGPNQIRKLDALTTLRFFAAAMIVVHHTRGNFGIPDDIAGRFMLDQAVSFFFVLSGFILTYVYPTLDTWEARGKFWLARFGRIWPAHIAAFGLLWLVLRNPAHFPTGTSSGWLAILNTAMVHAWVPVWNIFFSYNSVSWSISTEVGFYALFPLLIWKWGLTWWWKVPAALLLAMIMIQLCQWLHIPESPQGTWAVSQVGMVYIHPLARIFEFTVGMTAALIYRETAQYIRGHLVAMTLMEIGVIGLVAINMYYASTILSTVTAWRWPGTPGVLWAAHGPVCCLSFAALVYVMAMERGVISRGLGTWAGVLLGEISYTVYLLHWIMITFYQWNKRSFEAYPGWVVYLLFWAILLLLAWLIWAVVERPMRTWIVSLWPARKAARDDRGTRARTRHGIREVIFRPSWREFSVGSATLLVLLVPVGMSLLQSEGRVKRADHAEASAVAEHGVQAVRGARFGENIELVGAVLTPATGGMELQLAWRCVHEVRLEYMVAVHLLDETRKILAQLDFAQDIKQARVTPGAVWMDRVSMPAAKLKGVQQVGIALYIPGGGMEPIDRGPRDWDEHRLLLPLEKAGTKEASMRRE